MKKIITAGLALSFIISFIYYFIGNMKMVTFSLWVFAVFVSIYFIYSIVKLKKVYSFIALFTLISLLFQKFHLGYFYEIRYSMIIPILVYVFLLINWRKHRLNLIPIAFIVAYQILEFSTVIRIWISNLS